MTDGVFRVGEALQKAAATVPVHSQPAGHDADADVGRAETLAAGFNKRPARPEDGHHGRTKEGGEFPSGPAAPSVHDVVQINEADIRPRQDKVLMP